MINALKIVLFIWLLSNCTGINKAKRFKPSISKGIVKVDLKGILVDSISMYYSGCSGFYIKKGSNGVLHDPFLSNNGPLLKLNTMNLKVDTNLISEYFQQIIGSHYDSLGTIKALLASHTHYDHVLDFPYMITNFINNDSTLIGGNIGLKKLIDLENQNILNKTKPQFKDLASIASDSMQLKQWIYVQNRSIRILPILSEHAPHYFGIKLFGGNIDSTLTKMPTKAAEFKQGQSLAYMIDFLENEKTSFRIYIQGSASQWPAGFPPQLADGKSIDVAILCVASFRYVTDYPEEILKRLKPSYVILSHWENFFRARNGLSQIPAEVPFTDVKTFIKRFKKTATEIGIGGFALPESNTTIIFK